MRINTIRQNIDNLWQEIKDKPVKTQSQIFSLTLCGLFFIYSIIYCQFYVSYVVQVQTELTESILWALRRYGYWFIATHYLLMTYSNLWPNNKPHLIGLYLISILIGTGISVGTDLYLTSSSFLLASIINVIPTHLTAATLVLLCWAVLMRPNQNKHPSKATAIQNNTDISPEPRNMQILRVHTGTQECEICVSEIESISAAGNYMEVRAGTQVYIVRATIKDLETQLRPQRFIRIHRSHLINCSAIAKLHGNQSLELKSGRRFPISQRYQRNIIKKQYLA